MSRGEYDAMSLQGDSCAWECPKCTISMLPFANTSFISDDMKEALIGDTLLSGDEEDLYVDHVGECDILAKHYPGDVRLVHCNFQLES